MKHSVLIILWAAVLWAAPARAHDFWLQPLDFALDTPGNANVTVMMGHPKDRTFWPVDAHRVISFKTYGPHMLTDNQTSLSSVGEDKNLKLPMSAPGTHMVTIETTQSVSMLDAVKFNAYLDEEGLTAIQHWRSANDQTEAVGREVYSRRGKALVQVGAPTAKTSAHVTRPVGMTLEIVPETNPYLLGAGEPMGAVIYYRGTPVTGVKVLLISLDTMAGDVAEARSDDSGQVSFKRPARGKWMLHAVWSDPLEARSDIEFDTVFSSLSFGFTN